MAGKMMRGEGPVTLDQVPNKQAPEDVERVPGHKPVLDMQDEPLKRVVEYPQNLPADQDRATQRNLNRDAVFGERIEQQSDEPKAEGQGKEQSSGQEEETKAQGQEGKPTHDVPVTSSVISESLPE